MNNEKLNELAFDIHWKVEQWCKEIEKKKVIKQLQQEIDDIVEDYYNSKRELSRV